MCAPLLVGATTLPVIDFSSTIHSCKWHNFDNEKVVFISISNVFIQYVCVFNKQASSTQMYVLNHKVKTNTREKIYTIITKTVIKLLILYTLPQANPSTKTKLARNLYKRSSWKCFCQDVCYLLFWSNKSCFEQLHRHLKYVQYPVLDLNVTEQLAQSESENAISFNDESCTICWPRWSFPFTQRNILLNKTTVIFCWRIYILAKCVHSKS